MSLKEDHCVPCEGGVKPMSEQQAEKLLGQLVDWEYENNKIFKKFIFDDFKQALEFTNKVGAVAEKEGHHPDILLTWGKVTITLWTHQINGLSKNDFILAAKSDAL